jgi:archaetidylinositol phosphate synthase
VVLGVQRSRTRGLAAVLAWPFVVMRVPPNLLTLSALAPALVASYFAWQADWLLAFLWGLAAGLMDMIDGAVARTTKRVTAFGGYLDSLVDRYSDGLILLGIGLGLARTDAWLAVALGVVGTFGVSYARARSYQDVRMPAEDWNQLMERGERLILLALGLLGQWLADEFDRAWDILFWVLVIYAIGTNLTVVQRALRVKKRMDANR